MNFSKILEYQKIDMKVYKAEKDFYDSQELQELLKRQTMYKDKQASLPILAKELNELFASIDVLKQKLGELDGAKSTLEKDFSTFTTMEEFDEYEKLIKKYDEDFNFLNKDIGRVIKRISEIGYENKKIFDSLSAYQRELRELKNKLDKMQEKVMGDTREFRKELSAISKEVPPQMFAMYLELRKAKKMPAFAPFNSGACSVCCHEVDAKAVEEKGFTVCNHCGRIIFNNI